MFHAVSMMVPCSSSDQWGLPTLVKRFLIASTSFPCTILKSHHTDNVARVLDGQFA